MARILVVDDEKVMVKGIRFNLENEGYEVDVGYNGREAVDKARATDYDLIILDLMMPELDGLEACMEIRAFSTVPIIMLTARSEDADKLMGFACGADDYITKPFNILEVKARIRALLRRSTVAARPAAEESRSLLTVGDLSLNEETREVTLLGEGVTLTPTEFQILKLLMENPGKVPGSKAVYNKVVDSNGKTIKVYKDTFDPKGNLVHRKDK